MRTYSVKQQQGSALVWLVSLTMIVGMLALVVDASMLYFEKRKLQSIANEVVSAIGDMNKACNQNMNSIDLNALKLAAEAQISDPEIHVQEVGFLKIKTVNGLHQAVFLNDPARDQSNGITVLLKKDFDGFFPFIFGAFGELTARSTIKKEVVVVASLESKIVVDSSSSPILNLILGRFLGVDLNITTDLEDIAATVTDVSKLLENLLALDVPLNAIPLEFLLEGVLDAVEAPLSSGVGRGLDEIINKAAGVSLNVNLEHVIKGITSAETIPSGAEINTLNLLQSIIFNTNNGLPKTINIRSSDLLGILGSLGIAEADVELTITPSPAYLVSPVIVDEEGRYPFITSSNIEIGIKLDLLDIPIINIIASAGLINLDIEVGGGTFELNEISNCGVGSNNNIMRVGGESSGFLIEADADISLLKLLNIGPLSSLLEVEACFKPVNEQSGSYSAIVSVDLDDKNPKKLDASPKIYPLKAVTDLLASLGLKAKILGLGSCKPGEVVGVGLGDAFNELGDILSLLDDALINPILSVLGADLANQDLNIENLTQQSVLIEGELF